MERSANEKGFGQGISFPSMAAKVRPPKAKRRTVHTGFDAIGLGCLFFNCLLWFEDTAALSSGAQWWGIVERDRFLVQWSSLTWQGIPY